MKVDDILTNKVNGSKWKVVDVSERYNLATIQNSEGNERIINIINAEVDYILPEKQ